MSEPKYRILPPLGIMPNPQVFLPPSMRTTEGYDLGQKLAEVAPGQAPAQALAATPAPVEEPPPPTASEGLHPMALSPEEVFPASPLEQIVKQLLKLLKLK